MTYTHKDFVKQLKTGYDYQLKVKEILEQNGLEVFIDDSIPLYNITLPTKW